MAPTSEREGCLFVLLGATGDLMRRKLLPALFQLAENNQLPAAYETLLLDILAGDQTLFVHADETETSWRLYAPLLNRDAPPHPYPAGSWGPAEADSLLAGSGTKWSNR
ncbi:hypothetical protein [Propionivibrio sp.]|uniref:hypothetical protein n=1 Tax=Propionivibrio sp. TaxID=2212460 RepID=UPI003BEFC6BE